MSDMTNHSNLTPTPVDRPVALVTGGSAGLGLELVRALSARGWIVVTDGRTPSRLVDAVADLDGVDAVPGDVSDPAHRAELVDAVHRAGRLDLLVHNASTLGLLPLRALAELEASDLESVWAVNVAGPHELNRVLGADLLATDGVIISISSDAAVHHYGTWGAYGGSKAALDHLTLTVAAETGITAYAVDPGDLRTQMHADAFPGEDISDRPWPVTVVPHLLGLLAHRPPSGRYRAVDLAPLDDTTTTQRRTEVLA